uniref:Uncharacterized protein n=1 Tax=Anguilla anguilla TaxID=7936 RepID=A0A0E9RK86_ANGAN
MCFSYNAGLGSLSSPFLHLVKGSPSSKLLPLKLKGSAANQSIIWH